MKTKDLFISLRFTYFKVLTASAQSFLDRLNQHWKKGKKSTFERNLNVDPTPWSTSLRVKKLPFFVCFISIMWQKRIAGGWMMELN